MKDSSLHCRVASEGDIQRIMSWFEDVNQLRQWGGPELQLTQDPAEFRLQIGLERLHSYVMLDKSQQVLAFGQFYRRAGCFHLGRLAVAPIHRSQGLGKHLIRLLIAQARKISATEEHVKGDHEEPGIKPEKMSGIAPDSGQRHSLTTPISLFVMKDNPAAIRCYQAMGFTFSNYPESMPEHLSHCLYMKLAQP